jgi:tRNA (cytidine/uridine-2'-O-)-methyltransferase
VELVVHHDWRAAAAALGAESPRPFVERLRLFSARGGRSLFETEFAPEDVLVFGSESRGLPAELLDAHAARRVYIPVRPCVRSLNLANVVALATYTALVKAGVPLPANDGSYAPDARADEDVWPAEIARRGASA